MLEKPYHKACITQSYLENGLFRDTQRENIPSNKTQALSSAVALVFNILF